MLFFGVGLDGWFVVVHDEQNVMIQKKINRCNSFSINILMYIFIVYQIFLFQINRIADSRLLLFILIKFKLRKVKMA